MLRFINAYDGAVRFLDTELKRLYEYFNKKGLNRNTLWVIVSDHGEGLGNHNWLEHEKFLFNEQIKVTLIYYSPGLINKGVVSNRIVNLVDIIPTLVDLAGISNEKSIKAKSWAGISLAPFFTGLAGKYDTVPGGYAFAQRRQYMAPDPDDVISPEKGYAGESYSLQDNRYKYILHTAREDEFYDLENDHGELNNLISRGGKVERELKERLIDRIKYYRSTTGGLPEAIGREEIDKLKALGYVQ